MDYSRDDIVSMLRSEGDERDELFRRAVAVRDGAIGDGVYLRGLIEYSNICRKNCLYCGIRKDSTSDRYVLSPEQVIEAARYAWEHRYGSVVLQGGENTSPQHTALITQLLREITEVSGGELGITLSLGEQSPEVYREWREAGATRYLLRVETSDRELYRRIHPNDATHDFDRRVQALSDLREAGFMVGTGVMIGLPFQTIESLADDLLFMQRLDIDMCGMGPYILSEGTPLVQFAGELQTEQWRFDLTLKMIAALRLLMPDINIAATTALQAIDPHGRVKAIDAGANVIMPNLTPDDMRGNYLLYNNKPMSLDSKIMERNIRYGEKGDPQHFDKR
ncbi:[FeFe] hydrogenase H-cluster radical SAM maturase HydE [Alistipes sp. OttesenSCG-928-B03]|nr:[FeFe] hydrogenase H-cluster radical SAM maturase HydE [Alistipes sp. OttesenSCG-928-B03]